ncbi:MAG: response regulator, partial [Sulfurovum sp.]|nr:response regulator [Sulfurovum sp.]
SFVNLDKKITILDDGRHKFDAQNIYAYLLSFGLTSNNIVISNTFSLDTTHVFCFQNKLSDKLMAEIEEKQIQLLIIEDSILSLSKDKRYKDKKIMTLNTYYANAIHDFTYSKPRQKILIADDNKLNIMLLKAILEVEYVTIESVVDGKLALEKLHTAQKDNTPFDIVYIDQQMPYLLGSEVIKKYKESEKDYNHPPIYSISITGDPDIKEEDKSLFDIHLPKPFKKQSVRDSIPQRNVSP